MNLTDEQLAVILQACVDFTKELLEHDGGFRPFGARAKPDGEIEFLQLSHESADSLEDLYQRTGTILADEALRNEIVAATLIANVDLPNQPMADFQTAVVIQIEAANFCRSIVIPYRFGGDAAATVEFGKMEPQKAEAAVFMR